MEEVFQAGREAHRKAQLRDKVGLITKQKMAGDPLQLQTTCPAWPGLSFHPQLCKNRIVGHRWDTVWLR